jgi:hypothetical protein
MSSTHPPIPEPQAHPDAPSDEPRTQSILLPPSQRPTEQPEDPAAAQPSRATGPMDFVPGLGAAERPTAPPSGSTATHRPPTGPSTSPGSPRVDPAGSAPPRSRRPRPTSGGRSRTVLVSLGLGVLALAVLELGLALDFGSQSLWNVVPTWSVFATVAALVVLLPAIAGLTGRLPHRTAWVAGAVGLVALATAWVLVGLPLAASDRGFWLTAAVAAAGGSLWFAPGRSE